MGTLFSGHYGDSILLLLAVYLFDFLRMLSVCRWETGHVLVWLFIAYRAFADFVFYLSGHYHFWTADFYETESEHLYHHKLGRTVNQNLRWCFSACICAIIRTTNFAELEDYSDFWCKLLKLNPSKKRFQLTDLLASEGPPSTPS